jgi:hypothetical protein
MHLVTGPSDTRQSTMLLFLQDLIPHDGGVVDIVLQYLHWRRKGIDAEEKYNVLSRVPDQDAALLGFAAMTKPCFLVQKLVIIAPLKQRSLV